MDLTVASVVELTLYASFWILNVLWLWSRKSYIVIIWGRKRERIRMIYLTPRNKIYSQHERQFEIQDFGLCAQLCKNPKTALKWYITHDEIMRLLRRFPKEVVIANNKMSKEIILQPWQKHSLKKEKELNMISLSKICYLCSTQDQRQVACIAKNAPTKCSSYLSTS